MKVGFLAKSFFFQNKNRGVATVAVITVCMEVFNYNLFLVHFNILITSDVYKSEVNIQNCFRTDKVAGHLFNTVENINEKYCQT